MRSRCLPHGGTFSKGCKQVVQMQNCKRSVNYLKRACKNCVSVAYAVRGFFRGGHRSKRKFLSDQIEGVIAGRKTSSHLNKKVCGGYQKRLFVSD